MIRKISDKPTGTKIPHLHVNNREVTDIPDIANSLAQTFSDSSSSEQYSAKFQSYRRQAENNPLNFNSNNTETYNNPKAPLTSERPLLRIMTSRYGGWQR